MDRPTSHTFSRLASSLVALAAVAGTPFITQALGQTAASAAVAHVAPRTTPTRVSLVGGMTVKTSNGVSWTLAVSGGESSSPSGEFLSISLYRPVTTGGTGAEFHEWSFNVTSAFTWDESTGIATLNTGSQTSPVAAVNLRFTVKSHKPETCSSGSGTFYSGTLTGELELVTGLTGGGTVGGKSVTLDSTTEPSLVEVDDNCVVPAPCVSTNVWYAGSNPTGVGLGNILSSKNVDQVGVVKETDLAKPANALRADEALIDGPPATWNSATKKLSATTSTSGIVTGSVTLTGSKVTTVTKSCTYQGKKYTETDSTYVNAAWSSPAGKDLTAHTNLSGTLVVAGSGKTGYIDITSVKAA